jgi:plastocyanin
MANQMPTGAGWSWTAAGKGRLEYACTYHPGMKAAIVVQ